jgi:hypothetical protein
MACCGYEAHDMTPLGQGARTVCAPSPNSVVGSLVGVGPTAQGSEDTYDSTIFA